MGHSQAFHTIRSLLQWGDQVICQSMACARFIAREVGLAGNNNMESAQVDEIIDVIQDLINAGVKLFFAKDEAGMKKHAEVTVPTVLGQLETKLTKRGGQFFVGNNFSWADLRTFMYVSDLPDKSVLKSFPKIGNLVERVGTFQTSRTGWRQDQSQTCKQSYQDQSQTCKQSYQDHSQTCKQSYQPNTNQYLHSL